MTVRKWKRKTDQNMNAGGISRRWELRRRLASLCMAMLLSLTGSALCEEAIPNHAVRLSANLTFDGTAYLPDPKEYSVFDAEMAPLDGITPEKIVDLNGEHTWMTTERTQQAIPDVLYENELGDSFSVRNGDMDYLRNDVYSAVDALANQLSMLYGAPNQQATSTMLWDSKRDPVSDFDIDSLKEAGTLDIRQALSLADTAIRKMQLDQETTLVRCETDTVGDAYAGKVRFKPFWCFYMEYPSEGETFACTARLDAVTGEVMW